MIATKNPATGEILKEYSVMNAEEAISVAEKVWKNEWKKTKFSERAGLFLKLAAVLRRDKQEFAEMITKEMGKVIKESIAEVEKCALLAETLAENGEKWLEEEIVKAGGEKHIITFEPLGTVYLIMPWNYPFWQPLKVALLPLFAGNTILLKHAKNVTGCSLLVEDSFKRAGFPENVFKSLVISHETSDILIDSDFVQAVSLTGSIESGSKVASLAGKKIKKTVLELGGSDPFIVCEDADLDMAAKAAVAGRFGNCGQVCIGAKRIIVNQKIAKAFSDKFANEVSKLRQANPLDKETDVGPMVDEKALADMDMFVKDAKAKGGIILAGGNRFGNKGYFYRPTVIMNANSKMRMANEEVFGPVVPIIVVQDDNEAIKVANSTIYGLSASVWTNDLAKGEKIARKLECGGVFINHISVSNVLIPIGGTKKSGYGRELSHIGIKEFVNIKPINIYK